jgi:hypothetical protein
MHFTCSSELISAKILFIDPFLSPVFLLFLHLYGLGLVTYSNSELLFLKYESFRQLVGLLRRGRSPMQGLYLCRTTQSRKTKTNIHAVSGIRTHCLSDQAIKAYASERLLSFVYIFNFVLAFLWLCRQFLFFISFIFPFSFCLLYFFYSFFVYLFSIFYSFFHHFFLLLILFYLVFEFCSSILLFIIFLYSFLPTWTYLMIVYDVARNSSLCLSSACYCKWLDLFHDSKY